MKTMNYDAKQNPEEIEATLRELLDIRSQVESHAHMEVWASLYMQAYLLKHVNWR